MKFLAALLLIMASWLPATSQRSSYDPAAKQPSKQGDGFVDFALKQVNSQNKDYGCQIDDARKLLVDQTVKSITSWAVLVCLSFLVLSFFLLLHQHRERAPMGAVRQEASVLRSGVGHVTHRIGHTIIAKARVSFA